jgi:hypothetical protein
VRPEIRQKRSVHVSMLGPGRGFVKYIIASIHYASEKCRPLEPPV